MNIKYKISQWLIACLLMFLTISCEKDFLDKQPLTSVATTTFMTTKSEVETGLIGVYSRLQTDFLGYVRPYLETLSDNAWMGNIPWLHNYLYEMATGEIYPSRGGALDQMYKAPYSLINSCNAFLENENIDNATGLTADEVDVYKAEVRFLRALAYFDLVQFFGDVVLYKTTPTTVDGWYLPRSPKAEVYAFIEEDLNFAISKLPPELYTGHAVKGSAQGLLGRVLLTQGKWAEAATVLNQIITDPERPFSLSNSYENLFITSGQDDPLVNCEIMFSTRYLGPDDPHWPPNQMGINLEVGAWGFVQPFRDMIDSYQMTDGLPSSESPLYDGTDSSTMYLNRDPRLDMTVMLPTEIWINADGDTISRTSIERFEEGSILMQKYIEVSKAPFSKAQYANNEQDMVYLRYADVLLMYAEAKNEDSGPDASVYDALDALRNREGVKMPAVVRDKDQGTMREYIRNERRVELALEGHRYFDLKRWKIAHINLPKMTLPNDTATHYEFEQHNYFLPIPESEMDRNTKLVQTDGY